MNEIEALKRDVEEIKKRNLRVEADKAWETSLFRILTIVVITYSIASVALLGIGNDHPFRNALIPTIGFFLSVQSLPFIKRVWIKHYLKRREG